MPVQNIPSLAQVQGLPHYLRRTVPESFLDQNGHMNIQHYLGIYDEAGFPFFRDLGIDESYFTERKLGVFDLEHHISYLAECHAGDVVSVHGRIVSRTAKRLHAVWFLVNETRGQLSNILEFVSSHADLSARKTAPFPEDIATKLDAMIAEYAKLDWPPPTCGIMAA